jgi:hypothetical protein
MKVNTNTWIKDIPKSNDTSYGPKENDYRQEIQAVEEGLARELKSTS